jgi:hypothetical protein
MTQRPLSVAIIGVLFVAVGVVALLADLVPLVTGGAAALAEPPRELALAWAVRLLGILAGAFLLAGRNWARWLVIAWMGYHVILSVGHSAFEVAVHGVLLLALLYFLFRPPASEFFRATPAAG